MYSTIMELERQIGALTEKVKMALDEIRELEREAEASMWREMERDEVQ